MLKEFREFAMRGNVLDLAIGIIIGGAFGKIVSSFVSDVLTPPLGLLMGRLDFGNLFISLNGEAYSSLQAAKAAGAPTINYGLFINTVIDFLLVTLAVFILVKQINRLKRQEQPAPAEATTRDCPFCLSAVPLKAVKCGHCTSELPPA